jgi:pantoate--beta-alanine ligase
VIRRLVADLNLPVSVRALPTVREPDGLAMSSRNALLTPQERRRALALSVGLRAAAQAVANGERSIEAITAAALQPLHQADIEPEYLELVDPDSLEPLSALEGEGLLTVAARVGAVRLIDNVLLAPLAAPADQPRQGEELATCSA